MPFYQKKSFPNKLISRYNMQPNTPHSKEENTKVKLMFRIFKKLYVGSETGFGSGTNWKVGS
jgi:hypothetical protein